MKVAIEQAIRQNKVELVNEMGSDIIWTILNCSNGEAKLKKDIGNIGKS